MPCDRSSTRYPAGSNSRLDTNRADLRCTLGRLVSPNGRTGFDP